MHFRMHAVLLFKGGREGGRETRTMMGGGGKEEENKFRAYCIKNYLKYKCVKSYGVTVMDFGK